MENMRATSKVVLMALLINSSAVIAWGNGSGNEPSDDFANNAVTLNRIDIRLGHPPTSLLIRGKKCVYVSDASASKLGEIVFTPISKTCGNIETHMKAESLTTQSNTSRNAFTNEHINTLDAGHNINIQQWE